MPEPPPISRSPASFDFARLAEQHVAHRLSQPDLAPLLAALPDDRARAPLERLIEIFQRAGEIISLRWAIESHTPSSRTLAVVTNSLAAAVGARLCRLVFADRRHGGFVALRGDGSVGDERPRAALGGITRKVLADGVSRSADGLATHAEFDAASDAPAGETVRQMLCVALHRTGGIVGVLQLFDKAEGVFTDADRLLAEATAPTIAELAARASLIGPGEGDARTPLRLIEQSRFAADLSGRDLILSKILTVALDVLDADRAAIFVHDPLTEELYTRHTEGLGAHELRIDSGLGLVGAAFRNGEIVNVADAYQDARFNPALDWQIGYRTRSVLCAPIYGNDGRRVGVVQMLNKRRGVFTAADERRLKGLASQMGITIDYATLFEQTLSMKSYNESMLRSLSNGVITVDLARVVTFINQAAGRILRIDGLGLARGGLLPWGKNSRVLPGDHRPASVSHFAVLLVWHAGVAATLRRPKRPQRPHFARIQPVFGSSATARTARTARTAATLRPSEEFLLIFQRSAGCGDVADVRFDTSFYSIEMKILQFRVLTVDDTNLSTLGEGPLAIIDPPARSWPRRSTWPRDGAAAPKAPKRRAAPPDRQLGAAARALGRRAGHPIKKGGRSFCHCYTVAGH